MASRISHLALDDAAPYRRLAQFAPQAQFAAQAQLANAPRPTLTSRRRILGLPARIPVLTIVPRRPLARHDSHLDAA